jgi:phenylacetic acid degradation operon negative regulatory protein
MTPVPSDAELGPVSRRARHHVVTFLGAVVRRLDNWMPIAGAVDLLGEVGVDGASVRSAVFRLKKREWLVPVTREGARGYGLTDVALAELAAGDELIWHARQPADLQDGWCIVSFSVPEADRGVRHQMRARLTHLGFGNLGAGTWMAPARALRSAEKAVVEFGLGHQSTIFVGEYVNGPGLTELAYSLWSLDELNHNYRDFLAAHERTLLALTTRGPLTGREAFAVYLDVVDQWRRLPFQDPGLPLQVLHDDWAAPAASAVFEDVVRSVEEIAVDHAARRWPPAAGGR